MFSILFLFCIYSSRESYNNITHWLSDVRSLASPNIVIILCGNKKDLEDQRQVSYLEASRFAEEHGKKKQKTRQQNIYFEFLLFRIKFLDLIFYETSALTNENIEESFNRCADIILSKIQSGLFLYSMLY